MPTIQDVAKRAGVAPMTVSRVINQSGYASDEVRARVLAAVEELGYMPNTLARSLRIRRTHTLALDPHGYYQSLFYDPGTRRRRYRQRSRIHRAFRQHGRIRRKRNALPGDDPPKARGWDFCCSAGGFYPDCGAHSPERDAPGAARPARRRRIGGCGACDSEDGLYRLTRLLLELGTARSPINGPVRVSTAADRAAWLLPAHALKAGERPARAFRSIHPGFRLCHDPPGPEPTAPSDRLDRCQ